MSTRNRQRKKRRDLVVLILIVTLAICVPAAVGILIWRERQTEKQVPAESGQNAEPQWETLKEPLPRKAEPPADEGQGAEEAQVAEDSLEESPEAAPGMEENSGGDKGDGGESAREEDTEEMTKLSAPSDPAVEAYLQTMSLEDKVAQLFFVTPEALVGTQTVTAAGEQTKKAFDRHPVGGLIYLAPNLVSEAQTREMLGNMQKYSMDRLGIPVFLGLDEEGGRVLRIGGNSGFAVEKIRSAKSLAAGGKEAVFAAGDTIGSYLSELGFNLDLAPDADVLTNPANQVIGDRSFGSDPQEVADLAWAFSEGLRAHGVLSCYKHFPGHGGTAEDTHEGYAYSYKTLEEIRQSELIPFIDASRRGVEMIMAAHISMPGINGDDTPASLSEKLITGVLREEIGYQGIVITDALGMGAVSDHYRPGESAVLALQAGCDMLLMASHFSDSYQAVLDAVGSGELTEERIDASVRRILAVKLGMSRTESTRDGG